MASLTQYIKDSRAELKKVQWPTRQETTRYTILVIVISIAVAAFLGFFDYIFNLILEYLV